MALTLMAQERFISIQAITRQQGKFAFQFLLSGSVVILHNGTISFSQ